MWGVPLWSAQQAAQRFGRVWQRHLLGVLDALAVALRVGCARHRGYLNCRHAAQKVDLLGENDRPRLDPRTPARGSCIAA